MLLLRSFAPRSSPSCTHHPIPSPPRCAQLLHDRPPLHCHRSVAVSPQPDPVEIRKATAMADQGEASRSVSPAGSRRDPRGHGNGGSRRGHGLLPCPHTGHGCSHLPHLLPQIQPPAPSSTTNPFPHLLPPLPLSLPIGHIQSLKADLVHAVSVPLMQVVPVSMQRASGFVRGGAKPRGGRRDPTHARDFRPTPCIQCTEATPNRAKTARSATHQSHAVHHEEMCCGESPARDWRRWSGGLWPSLQMSL